MSTLHNGSKSASIGDNESAQVVADLCESLSTNENGLGDVASALRDHSFPAFMVEGCSGEYSDRTDWAVRVFLNRGHAEALVIRLAAWCDVHGCGENGGGLDADKYAERHPPEDPGFRSDYTGTRYYIVEVPLTLFAVDTDNVQLTKERTGSAK